MDYYKKNVNIDTTTHGDKVITMSECAYQMLLYCVSRASGYCEEHGMHLIADDARSLWLALNDDPDLK